MARARREPDRTAELALAFFISLFVVAFSVLVHQKKNEGFVRGRSCVCTGSGWSRSRGWAALCLYHRNLAVWLVSSNPAVLSALSQEACLGDATLCAEALAVMVVGAKAIGPNRFLIPESAYSSCPFPDP